MISAVSKVVVPVDDQQQAKEFWVDRLGFELQRDESYGGERWIEVSPPGQRLILALTWRTPHEARQDLPDQLPHSPVFFNCADIEQTYRELTERGVEFPVPPERQHFGWWALFADPDGTRYALGQWD
jgi:predicted enzyme related to lactoylglutathione lyase